MPVQGISSSAVAFSQADFDRTRREIDLNGQGLDVPRRRQGGPGGGPFWTNTVQSQSVAEQQAEADGYNALRLAPTQFQSSYGGQLLNQNFHLLNPAFHYQAVDFHA